MIESLRFWLAENSKTREMCSRNTYVQNIENRTALSIIIHEVKQLSTKIPFSLRRIFSDKNLHKNPLRSNDITVTRHSSGDLCRPLWLTVTVIVMEEESNRSLCRLYNLAQLNCNASRWKETSVPRRAVDARVSSRMFNAVVAPFKWWDAQCPSWPR